MNAMGGDASKLGRMPMSFEPSLNDRASAPRYVNAGVLSILVALISPLIAVLLSYYLNLSSRPKCQTTFAMPVPCLDVSPPAGLPPEPVQAPSAAETSPRIRAQGWEAFAPQPQKQALAARLIARASGVKDDPASQLVMLRHAKDVAVQANDGRTAFQAIDAMAGAFHVDADAMKMSALKSLASVARKSAQHKFIAEQALELEDRTAAQGHFTVASQLGILAIAEAKRSLDHELLADARAGVAEVVERVRAKELAARPSADRRQ
jgi:hypothetical protein